jgi:hypothetical protein
VVYLLGEGSKYMDDKIDVNLDLRIGLKESQDPDKDSKILKGYHKKLWGKKLPSGLLLDLSDSTSKDCNYLFFQTDSQGIRLSSDWIINTYLHWPSLNGLKNEFLVKYEKEYNDFNKIAHTIGSYILFPLYPIDTPRGAQTINQARCTRYADKIKDRFDLTLECIRRYYNKKENPYINEENPLGNVIERFDDYFQLFKSFEGFCNFFFLQDLTKKYTEIDFFLKFNKFEPNPQPKTSEDYFIYMNKATEFIKTRNKRIMDYAKIHNL